MSAFAKQTAGAARSVSSSCFENGASIAIDDSFPARATLAEAAVFQSALVGRRFDSFELSRKAMTHLKEGTALETLEVRISTHATDVVGEWKAIHCPGFDVEPGPRVTSRPAPSYGTA